MKKFPHIQSDSREVNMLQDNIINALNPLLSLPLSDSNLIRGVELLTGSNSINHGLGRPLIGWILTRKDADENVYDNQSNNPLPERTLLLVSTGDVSVDVMVF